MFENERGCENPTTPKTEALYQVQTRSASSPWGNSKIPLDEHPFILDWSNSTPVILWRAEWERGSVMP